jgi:hypothetical protein
MNHRRRRLRVPAVLAGALWLLAGFANAAGMGTCSEHDHYGSDGSGHAAGATHGSAPQAGHDGDHDHHGAEHAAHGHVAHDHTPAEHATHGPTHATHGPTAAEADAPSDGSSAEGACTCGAFRCVDSSGAAGLEVPAVTVALEDTSEPTVEIPSRSDVRPTVLIPHFLPPSNGPPSA